MNAIALFHSLAQARLRGVYGSGFAAPAVPLPGKNILHAKVPSVNPYSGKGITEGTFYAFTFGAGGAALFPQRLILVHLANGKVQFVQERE